MMDDETAPGEYQIPAHLGVTMPLAPGTPTTGLWCDTCLLPSRYAVPVYVLGADGPYQIDVVDRCTEEHPA